MREGGGTNRMPRTCINLFTCIIINTCTCKEDERTKTCMCTCFVIA